MARNTEGTRRDIYAEVTEKVLALLEEGTVPWHRPWDAAAGLPTSMSTRRPYRGVNVFLLDTVAMVEGYGSPWWGTYRQIAELGGQVRKGERSTLVVFWRILEREATPEERARTGQAKVRIPMLRQFNVFNAAQADGLGEAFSGAPSGQAFDPVASAEAIVEGWAGRPEIVHGGSRACYVPSRDRVCLPQPSAFSSADEYYSTMFHELTHSTGHASRLARPTLLESHSFGDESYSKEELVAEMGAAMLSAVAGIHQRTIEASASYLASWLRVLRAEPRMLVQAAGQAQRAADLILGTEAAIEAVAA